MAIIETLAYDDTIMLSKRHISLYCRGFEGAAALRRELGDAETKEQVDAVVEAFCKGVLENGKEE